MRVNAANKTYSVCRLARSKSLALGVSNRRFESFHTDQTYYLITPLKLTRWKRLFEEQEGVARHHVAAPVFQRRVSSAVEQRLDKAQADGSIPSSTTSHRAMAEWTKAAVCKTVHHRRFESDSRVQLFIFFASVAQWIRAPVYEAGGCRFESCRARHTFSVSR